MPEVESALEFDFDFDVNVNRAALLQDAARRLDQRQHDLGTGGKGGPSVEGNELRALLDDGADWAESVEAYEITSADFLTKKLAAPVPFLQLADRYRFLWLHLPIWLDAKLKWGFSKLVAKIEFNPDLEGKPGRPTAYDILPNPQFQTLLEATDFLDVNLGIDSDFKVSQKVAVPTNVTGSQAKVAISVDGVAKGGVGAVVGPFTYRIVRAQIQRTDTGIERVKWQIVGQEFFRQTKPQLVVIARVPRQTPHVSIKAELAAYRFFNLGDSGLWQALHDLPQALKDFFVNQGAPLYACRRYEDVGEEEARSSRCK